MEASASTEKQTLKETGNSKTIEQKQPKATGAKTPFLPSFSGKLCRWLRLEMIR
jgi:hypothetical protein